MATLSTDDFFFAKFWEIQECLNDPELILISELSWEKFTSNFETILQTFGGIEAPTVAVRRYHSILGSTFFPKYTANPSLMMMQLDDLEFRQQILLQFYIMTDYLKSRGKFQKKELSPQQLDWCSATLEKIVGLIEKYDIIYKCDFASVVTNVIKNEELWSEWKSRGCPPLTGEKFEIAAPSLATSVDYKRWDFSCQPTFDNPRLNHLWNISPDNLEACKLYQSGNNVSRTLDSFLQACRQTNPHAFDSANKVTAQPWFHWRALRLLARECPQFFSPPSSQNLTTYIESLICARSGASQ